MVEKNNYSTALSGAGFMMFEVKQLATLKLAGLTDKEMRAKVIDENIFQANKISSVKRSLTYLIQRVNVLDETLLEMIVEADIQTAKVVNLYAIMKSDALFNEFMMEVVQEKLKETGNTLDKKDVNVFFRHKAEQSDFIHKLAESSANRLKSQFIRLLIEVGLMKSRNTGVLERIFIDEQVIDYLTKIGDKAYVQAMGVSE